MNFSTIEFDSIFDSTINLIKNNFIPYLYVQIGISYILYV